MMRNIEDMTTTEIMSRWPRLCGHLIAESLGYFTPEAAALFIKDAVSTGSSFCEWCMHTYRGNAVMALKRAIKDRHLHRGFMAEYKTARRLVNAAIRGVDIPLMSW